MLFEGLKSRGRPVAGRQARKEVSVGSRFRDETEGEREGYLPTAEATGPASNPKSNQKKSILNILTVVLRVIAVLLVACDFILLLPLNFQNIAVIKNCSYIIPYLLPFLFFVLLLVFGLKGMIEGKFILRRSILSLVILLFGGYFLVYLLFLDRNVFSYLYLDPTIYILAPLAYFFVEAIASKTSYKKGWLTAGIVACFAVFLIANPYLRTFYKNTLKFNVTNIPVLSLSNSWSIGMDTLKNRPVFGMGPGNYEYAFTQFKPASFNMSENWLLRFDCAGNLFFQVVTLGGIVGLIFMLSLFLLAIRGFPLRQNPVLGGFYITALLLTCVAIPFSLPLLFFLFLLLALGSAYANGKEIVISGKPAVYSFAAVAMALSAVGGFFLVKVSLADYNFQKALTAQAENNGVDTYNSLIEAIKLNPQSDLYHRVYAQVNLLLADSVGSKEDLTESDKSQIQQLVGQSVREVRIATEQTNPTSSLNWELRGQIYNSLNGVVQNADQLAAEAFSQAINLDPMNPLLKIDLGGIYYQAKNYNDAQTLFQDAIRVKSDYANAYYNLANALKNHGDTADAIARLTQALSLIDKSNADYEAANALLESWKKEAGITDTSTDQNGTPSNGANEASGSANP